MGHFLQAGSAVPMDHVEATVNLVDLIDDKITFAMKHRSGETLFNKLYVTLTWDYVKLKCISLFTSSLQDLFLNAVGKPVPMTQRKL